MILVGILLFIGSAAGIAYAVTMLFDIREQELKEKIRKIKAGE